MSKKKTTKFAVQASNAPQYAGLLGEIKQRIRHAQARAWMAVNAELIRLYWCVGQIIDQRQQQEGYGTGVIPRLARDLHNELPEEKGFSERNIKRMLAFYRLYPDVALDAELVPQTVAQVAATLTDEARLPAMGFSAPLLLAIPWGHHAVLMEKVKDAAARQWYMQAALDNGWSRYLLQDHISAASYQRAGKAANNFSLRLPAPDSALVQQTLKDPYLFDFLTLAEPFLERELETGLMAHLQKFLLELGQGFAFVGRQYRVELGEQDFYIDLLFYHLKLRCYVVIDLKRGAFKPEYAGKMSFYCNVVNDQLRNGDDKPTIGLILCQEHNRVLAEYTLRGMDNPIGVSSYELTRALPAELESSLPSIEQIERELAGGDTSVEDETE
ncbi:MAG: PDDEXK nuclease domain-containing protein [Marinagarivorans sp.]|nr:PDDEXK nuclease domain-containing protein [Marinagarivorans sp.]